MTGYYHDEILYLAGAPDPYAYAVYESLLAEWPQINPQTKLVYTDYREVQIVAPVQMSWWDNLILVPRSGWKPLRYYLFYDGPLDTPAQRWQYSTKLLAAAWTAPRYALWRLAGSLFRRPAWHRRGMEQQPNPVAPRPPVETLRLKQMSWVDSQGNYRFLACAYYPATDTFFVAAEPQEVRRVRERMKKGA